MVDRSVNLMDSLILYMGGERQGRRHTFFHT